MLWYAAAAALACWLLLLGYAAVAARPRWTRPGSPSLALRDEPPAVVSLLAGRIGRDGFPATVLDLAARGWLILNQEGGQLVMASVRLDGPPAGEAELALTRLAPIIAARLPSPAERDETPA